MSAGWGPRVRRAFRLPDDPATVAGDVRQELAFHIDACVDELVAGGMAPAAARTEALRRFGDVERVDAECRVLAAEVAQRRRRAERLSTVWQDVRFGVRGLRRTPLFTAAAVLTLALGIGITTAVFSAVNGVLLRPLPYPEPDRLVRLYERTERGGDRVALAGANAEDIRRESRTLAGLTTWGEGTVTVLGADAPRRTQAAWVSPEFFAVLGVPAAIGRVPREPGGAVVSHRFWTTALGGADALDQRALRIEGTTFPIVGVMPPDFAFPAGTDVWVTFVDDMTSRSAHNWSAVARLAPGATPGTAVAELDPLMRRLKAQSADMDATGLTVAPLHDELARPARRMLLLLGGAVALVLLLACVNLASANLARADARRRELAMRAALGASRRRLVRQLLTENVVLALGGGVLGAALAWALLRLVEAGATGALPRFAHVRLDMRVLAFTAAVSVLTGIFIGIAPALRSTRGLRSAIGHGDRAGGGTLRTRAVLIGAEVALAVALLAGAGLLVRSLGALLGTDPGFRAARVLTMDMALPSADYADTARIVRLFDALLPSLRAIPGVESVSLINRLPLRGGGMTSGVMVDGGEESAGDAAYRVIDTTYFRTLGIPLVRGRALGAGDVAGAPHAVVINEAMARTLWPGADPIGHRIRLPGMDRHTTQWMTVVGVVGDVRDQSLDRPASPALFVPYAQRPERLVSGAVVLVRSALPTSTIAAAARARAAAAEPNAPVELSTIEAVVDASVAERRFTTSVISAFAGLALVLAALGIYGVLAYSVTQRHREIGIRMALGAPARRVGAMVLADAMRAVVPGLLVGLAGAVALTRLLRGMLYGVSATDPATYLVVTLLLLATALTASWIPVRRATRVSPVATLRES